MKLTQEQIDDIACKVSSGESLIRVLQELEIDISGAWVSAKERLPTEKDANKEGEVFIILDDGSAYYSLWDEIDNDAKYWMPFPKELEKPKDPLEQWWETHKDNFPPGVGIYDIKPIYELGQKKCTNQ